MSLGILDAITSRETVGDTLTVEPQTNYLVARLSQDMRQGKTGLGAILTATDRSLDAASEPYLRREAYTSGIDFRHRFGPNDNFQVTSNVVGSVVRGSEEAIAATQRSSVHFYQRPDDHLEYDSTRTSLSGFGASLGFNKVGGGVTRFWTGGYYRSPGLEVNDVGFMTNVNSMGWSSWLGLVYEKPRAFYRRLQVNFNQWNAFFANGTNTGVGGNINVNATLKNQWFVYSGIGGELASYCGSCLRGGPVLREDQNMNGWAGFGSDSRYPISFGMDSHFGSSDRGRSSGYFVGPWVNLRVASQFSASLGVSYSRYVSDRQWLGNFGDIGVDTTHYTVAHLDQTTLSLTSRLNFTVSPTLSIQFYAQPFTSAGTYTNWREVAAPRSTSYDARYRPFTLAGDPGANDFNFKQFRSNTVVRWEYRSGSTLYLVWGQGREQSDIDLGQFSGLRDYRNLFGAHPRNTLLIKASYWFAL
jgi:hypothetical protein